MSTLHMRRAAAAAFVFGLATLGACASTSRSEGTGEYVDDAVITTKIKAAVLNDPSLRSSEINVETFKGKVQLSGFVNARDQKNRAGDIAKKVQGVKELQNNITVKETGN